MSYTWEYVTDAYIFYMSVQAYANVAFPASNFYASLVQELSAQEIPADKIFAAYEWATPLEKKRQKLRNSTICRIIP